MNCERTYSLQRVLTANPVSLLDFSSAIEVGYCLVLIVFCVCSFSLCDYSHIFRLDASALLCVLRNGSELYQNDNYFSESWHDRRLTGQRPHSSRPTAFIHSSLIHHSKSAAFVTYEHNKSNANKSEIKINQYRIQF